LASIAPNTTIRLLKNCPLVNNYEHTIYFADASAQATYFSGLTKQVFSDQSYQRQGAGRLRVQACADNIYDCNYLMFQNSSFGSKWFYAFITNIEYINNVVSEITYELDVMQTWFFDYNLQLCFVEREHTETDGIGGNIVPESIEMGEYIFNDYAPIWDLTEMAVIIAIVDVDGSSEGAVYDGVYGGCELWAYNLSDVVSINDKINDYKQKPESIVSMYMLPAKCVKPSIATGGEKITNNASGRQQAVVIPALTDEATLDGYEPRNKKLLTYPYNFYHVDNANGQELSLRYEFFDKMTVYLAVDTTLTQPVQLVLRPYNYKGIQRSDELNTLNTESITLTNFPMCSWNNDSFQMWISQNAVPMAANAAVSLGTAVATGGLTAVGTVGTITGMLMQGYQASIAADVSRGSFSNGGANTANGKQQFYGGRCSITGRMARTIDSYFDMFGYAVKYIKVPNRSSRPHWNYTKTVGCVIKGSVPAGDANKICSIYDKGVTFWKSGDEIGMYNLDNRPSASA
jgi:hypothetical protein